MAIQNQPQTTSEDTKTIVTILLLVFVYPAGFILMWVWTKWKMWVKFLVSCVTCPILILIVIMAVSAFSVGILTVINPAEQIRKGNCVKQCEQSVNKEACIINCIEKLAPSTAITPED